jgi:hypothetical protein
VNNTDDDDDDGAFGCEVNGKEIFIPQAWDLIQSQWLTKHDLSHKEAIR